VVGIDGDVHDVPRVDVARDDEIAVERAAVVLAVDAERTETDGARLCKLAGEHRARPRRAVRAPLDLLDRREVGESETAELERRQWTLRSASGTRR
jgi:hypothetical protein